MSHSPHSTPALSAFVRYISSDPPQHSRPHGALYALCVETTVHPAAPTLSRHRGTKRLGSIARAHHDWHWLDWRRDAREPRVVVRAHHEESASELRAGCSMRSMMALICVIARLGGITVSLHWGGQFGVRESGEPIPAHLWVIVKKRYWEALTQGVGLP